MTEFPLIIFAVISARLSKTTLSNFALIKSSYICRETKMRTYKTTAPPILCYCMYLILTQRTMDQQKIFRKKADAVTKPPYVETWSYGGRYNNEIYCFFQTPTPGRRCNVVRLDSRRNGKKSLYGKYGR